MYNHTLLKLSIFYTKFMDENMFAHQFQKNNQIWILLQLLCCNLKNKFELSLEDI
jgi:hypothetical protein